MEAPAARRGGVGALPLAGRNVRGPPLRLEITKDAYDRVLRLQQVRVAQQLTNGKLFAAAQPKLPSFAPGSDECVRTATSSLPKAERGAIPEADIRKACEAVPERTRIQAMQQVVAREVMEREAQDAGVQVTEDEVAKELDAVLRREIGGRGNLGKLDAVADIGEQDLRLDIRQSIVFAKVVKKIADDAGPVTEADVDAEYERHRAQYAKAASRERIEEVLKDQLRTTKHQGAVVRWQEGVQKRWRARTTCAAGYAVVALCGNGPDPSTTTTPAAPTEPAAGE